MCGFRVLPRRRRFGLVRFAWSFLSRTKSRGLSRRLTVAISKAVAWFRLPCGRARPQWHPPRGISRGSISSVAHGTRPMAALEGFRFEYPPPLVKSRGGRSTNLDGNTPALELFTPRFCFVFFFQEETFNANLENVSRNSVGLTTSEEQMIACNPSKRELIFRIINNSSHQVQ